MAVELLLFPPPPATLGNHEESWAEAAAVAERWLCGRDWAQSGRGRVVPSIDLLGGLRGPDTSTTSTAKANSVFLTWA